MATGTLIRVPSLASYGGNGDNCLLISRASPSRRSGIGCRRRQLMVVEAKGKRGGMAARQFQRPPPPLPKIEEDGNPKFVIFIRTANVYLWYPLSLITGGTTAKIMVAAKDNFLGKYIYKDTLARNIAAVIYRDEREIQKTAFKQFRVLRSAKEFRYGYKLVVILSLGPFKQFRFSENSNIRAALSTSDVIELPRQEELKTVLDKVKDFFGEATSGAKESFGKLTSLGTETTEEPDSTLKSDKGKAGWGIRKAGSEREVAGSGLKCSDLTYVVKARA
ncbi:hypothetical protein KSP39_PZI015655 [Platanthera zijinensis]|uniref:Protein HHL1, chloroplastic n=1 Tax=Platanthera zijinensis TaxID=2320716 RepID=A0AAP0G1L9_9ASPA